VKVDINTRFRDMVIGICIYEGLYRPQIGFYGSGVRDGDSGGALGGRTVDWLFNKLRRQAILAGPTAGIWLCVYFPNKYQSE